MNELTDAVTVYCANCATPLQGEFCHHCGQSMHSVLKPVHHMLEDGMDMFLHVDARIVHTLPPLLLKPGFLTLEYFSGRRQRYVAPFRLMFVLCLLAFFAIHLAVDTVVSRTEATAAKGQIDKDVFADADTPQEVRSELRGQLRGLAIARRTLPNLGGVLDANERELRALANQRLAVIGAPPLAADVLPATSASIQAPPSAHSRLPGLDHALRTHDDWKAEPVHVSWLPGFMNERLDTYVQRMMANLSDAVKSEDPAVRHTAIDRLVAGVFSVLPQAMVVMIPLFALLLKLFYVFKRRLYMEHLIVALHSHAFLFLMLLLATVLGTLSTWLRPHAAWVGHALGYPQAAVLLWMPVYLLVMQKRIYRQGWPMTLFKYWCVGWCYFWLLGVVALVAAVMGAGH